MLPLPPWANAWCGGTEWWKDYYTPGHIPTDIVKPDTTDRLVWFDEEYICKNGTDHSSGQVGDQQFCACEGGRPTNLPFDLPGHPNLLGYLAPERCELAKHCDDSDWIMFKLLIPEYGSDGKIYFIPKWIPKIPEQIQQKLPIINTSG